MQTSFTYVRTTVVRGWLFTKQLLFLASTRLVIILLKTCSVTSNWISAHFYRNRLAITKREKRDGGLRL